MIQQIGGDKRLRFRYLPAIQKTPAIGDSLAKILAFAAT